MTTVTFHCDVARFERHAIVAVHGDLDLGSAPVLANEVLRTLSRPMHGVVLDLAYCSSLDEAGLRVLLALYQRAQDLGIDFLLTAVPHTIEGVLLESRLAEAFDLRDGQNARRPATPQ